MKLTLFALFRQPFSKRAFEMTCHDGEICSSVEASQLRLLAFQLLNHLSGWCGNLCRVAQHLPGDLPCMALFCHDAFSERQHVVTTSSGECPK